MKDSVFLSQQRMTQWICRRMKNPTIQEERSEKMNGRIQPIRRETKKRKMMPMGMRLRISAKIIE